MGDIIFAARLPLATSVNKLHGYNSWTGSHYLTPEAVEYKDTVLRILNYYPLAKDKSQFAPWQIFALDMDKIKIIRELKLNKSKAKKVLAMHRQYSMEMLCVFDRESHDLDNRWKLCQDTVTSWLGFNDNKIIETHGNRMVNKNMVPQAIVKIREMTVAWTVEDYVADIRNELALPAQYGETA